VIREFTPHVLIATPDGVFIVRPEHETEHCHNGNDPELLPRCAGCRYHVLVDQLLLLHTPNIATEQDRKEMQRYEDI
jgi:hypothetical protein